MLISGAFAAWAAEPAHLTSSPYQGAEIQTGGSYYLYNVETGTWVDLNDQIPYAWSCTGTLNKDGFDIRLDKPDGFVGYKLFTNTVNNSSLRADQCWKGTTGWANFTNVDDINRVTGTDARPHLARRMAITSAKPARSRISFPVNSNSSRRFPLENSPTAFM